MMSRRPLAGSLERRSAKRVGLHLLTSASELPVTWTQLRPLWLQADIAAGRGDLAAAERDYLATRDGFISQGIGYDAAMASLDLAVLYLRQGRTAEVRRLAEEMLPLFEAQDVHREALAALSLFLEAAGRTSSRSKPPSSRGIAPLSASRDDRASRAPSGRRRNHLTARPTKTGRRRPPCRRLCPIQFSKIACISPSTPRLLP